MSGALYNLAAMTVASTGTGTITLGSAATINGVLYLSFASAGVPNGASVYYSINDPSGASEVGLGTYTSSGTTLTRGAITSTNSNNAINMSANAIVRITPPTSQFREILTTDRNYYVRTDGSDSNTGLANTSGAAFLTIQKAVNTVKSLDLSVSSATINIADGTYTGAITLGNAPYVGGGQMNIVGNTTTPSNVVISVTSADAISAINAGYWSISGIKIQTTTSGSGINAQGGPTYLSLNKVDFGAIANPYYQISSFGGATVNITGNYTISGGTTGNHLRADVNGSIISNSGLTITLSGTPAFGVYAFAYRGGVIGMGGQTFSGSATGTRYSASLNGVIDVNGGGATYLPGNAAGSTATGGQYA